MPALDTRSQVTATAAPTGGSAYRPDEDDLAQMAQVHSIHAVLDLCPALPLDVRLGLLDHAWALLGGSGQPASSPREAAHA